MFQGVINDAELEIIAEQPGWQPYYCLDVMRHVFTDAMQTQTGKNRVCSGQFEAMESSIRDMATAIGGLIRVKSTGLPASYDTFFKLSGFNFFLAATFSWSPDMGWYTPLVVVSGTIMFVILTQIGKLLE